MGEGAKDELKINWAKTKYVRSGGFIRDQVHVDNESVVEVVHHIHLGQEIHIRHRKVMARRRESWAKFSHKKEVLKVTLPVKTVQCSGLEGNDLQKRVIIIDESRTAETCSHSGGHRKISALHIAAC